MKRLLQAEYDNFYKNLLVKHDKSVLHEKSEINDKKLNEYNEKDVVEFENQNHYENETRYIDIGTPPLPENML